MNKILVSMVLALFSFNVYANELVTRCFPVAQNINGQVVILEKCETHSMPVYNGPRSYGNNTSAYGFGIPAPNVIESSVRGMAIREFMNVSPYAGYLVPFIFNK